MGFVSDELRRKTSPSQYTTFRAHATKTDCVYPYIYEIGSKMTVYALARKGRKDRTTA